MQKRILVDGRIFSLQRKGGVSKLWAELLKQFVVRNHHQIFLALYSKWDENAHLMAEWNRVSSRLHWFQLSLPPSDNERFSASDSDATREAECYAHSGHYDLVLNTYYGRSLLGERARQLVVFHDFAHEELAFFKGRPSTPHVERLKQAALETASAAVCISKFTRQRFLHHYPHFPPSKLFLIYHGHDTVPAVRKMRSLVYVGGRGGYKNFSVLQQALPRLLREWDGNIHIAGGEGVDDVMRSALISGGGRIAFYSDPSDTEINAAIASAQAYLSTSTYEGFGIPVLQALASETVCVLSDIPVYREIAPDAIFFAPSDPNNLVEAIKRSSLQSPTWKPNRPWSRVGNEYLDLLSKLL